MKRLFRITALLVVSSLVVSGCDSCQSEPEKPKVEPKAVPDVSVEEEPVDPLAEAKADADEKSVAAAVLLNDSARATASAMEALAKKPDTKPRIKKPRPEKATGKIEDTAALKRAFNKHNGAMRKCYERVLKMEPGLEGKVKLTVKIGSDGKVDWAKAKGRSLNHPKVNDCMEQQARTIKFPEPSGGAVIVANPYTFTPEL